MMIEHWKSACRNDITQQNKLPPLGEKTIMCTTRRGRREPQDRGSTQKKQKWNSKHTKNRHYAQVSSRWLLRRHTVVFFLFPEHMEEREVLLLMCWCWWRWRRRCVVVTVRLLLVDDALLLLLLGCCIARLFSFVVVLRGFGCAVVAVALGLLPRWFCPDRKIKINKKRGRSEEWGRARQREKCEAPQ